MLRGVGEGIRVKFVLNRLGERLLPALEARAWEPIARTLQMLEELGCFPCMMDGKMAGNIAVRHADTLIVSRSGRRPGGLSAADLVEVTAFNPIRWRVSYYSATADIEPTSDTPLHWTALMDLPGRLGWSATPLVSVHGHAISTEWEARLLGLPISHHETEFSTPADREALIDLMRRSPYPEHQVYVRRGHGFFVVAGDCDAALTVTKDLIARRQALTAPAPATVPAGARISDG